MPLEFTPKAFRDLSDVQAFLAKVSPQGLSNVVTALQRCFALIEERPMAGRLTNRASVRMIVEPRYRYVISYELRPSAILILRVHHPRQSRRSETKT